MFSIRENLDKKRQEVVMKLCEKKLEELFIRFNNVLRFKYEEIELLIKREVTIIVTKVNHADVEVRIRTETSKGEVVTVSKIFSHTPKFNEMVYILKYMLERENFKYEVLENIPYATFKIVFEI